MEPTLITYKGKTQSITAWANEYKISSGALSGRLKSGWDLEKALTEPPKECAKKYEYQGKLYTIEELTIIHGNISKAAMRMRLMTHTVEEALTMPNGHPTRKTRITEEQQKKIFKPKPKQPDTKKCRRCIYHGSLSGHGNANYGEIYCAYIEIMLKRRPCPPGEKCTEYKKGRSILRRTALKRFTG